MPSVLGAALLIAVPSSWINRRMLSLPPLVFIGRVSYSWYAALNIQVQHIQKG